MSCGRPLVLVALLVAVPVLAAPRLKPEKKVPSIAGTSWAGQTAEGQAMTIEFMADGTMNVTYGGNSFNRATWKQDGDKIFWEMNDHYCEFNGKLTGDAITGDSHNVKGRVWETKLTRVTKEP
ncbi:MAG: hypothetical protein J2P46_17335 [Zavarzinella sp.]|nr:hypothetical protein [Zavarzinella sp.]